MKSDGVLIKPLVLPNPSVVDFQGKRIGTEEIRVLCPA